MDIAIPAPDKCPLCGSTSFENRYKNVKRFKRSYNVYECKGCGLGITHPFPGLDHLTGLYSSTSYRDKGGKRFIAPVETVVRSLRTGRLNKIESLSTKGRMLDVGCGLGLMLALARDRGWEVVGLEFNNETAAPARKEFGLNVRTGRLSNNGFEKCSLDVITFWHSLEHLEDAVDDVREAAKLLKPGGLLLLSVPNFESLQSRMSGPGWFHLDVPFHLYHFSASNIKKLLKDAGLEVVRQEHFSLEFNPFGFIQSFLNMAGLRHNLLYDILKTGSLRPEGDERGSAADTYITALLLPFVGIASVFFTALEVLFRRGGTVDIYARKSPLIKARLRTPAKTPPVFEGNTYMEPEGHQKNMSD
ncbi:MAG: class I SAM-dependent methyltransferase [Thermodesulfovibrionales bacterium]|nr:class I SAM-dependent methyltransferase [Thermodesulfovibrionales bacterium]